MTCVMTLRKFPPIIRPNVILDGQQTKMLILHSECYASENFLQPFQDIILNGWHVHGHCDGEGS